MVFIYSGGKSGSNLRLLNRKTFKLIAPGFRMDITQKFKWFEVFLMVWKNAHYNVKSKWNKTISIYANIHLYKNILNRLESQWTRN